MVLCRLTCMPYAPRSAIPERSGVPNGLLHFAFPLANSASRPLAGRGLGGDLRAGRQEKPEIDREVLGPADAYRQ